MATVDDKKIIFSMVGVSKIIPQNQKQILNYLIPQLGTSTIELNFSAPSRDSVKEFISKIKQKGMEVHSYELKERRFSKEEFVEASIEIKAKRGFHTLEILDYMNDFSDVTISTIK
jgi:putative Mg2+ transporter-C (MgtC) family protein